MNALTAIATDLLHIAAHLEWAERRAGCTEGYRLQAMYWNACPSCGGVRGEINADPSSQFPADQIGHRENCQLRQNIELLRKLVIGQ